MRFVAERLSPGNWECHAEGNPRMMTGGPTPESALRQACHVYGVEITGLAVVERSDARIVFSATATCPECGGSGRYVGLSVVEPCRACGGVGRA